MTWASDVPVSLPQAPVDEVLVPMDGFCFTDSGLFPHITDATVEALTPRYQPHFDPREVVNNLGY